MEFLGKVMNALTGTSTGMNFGEVKCKRKFKFYAVKVCEK